MINCGTLTKTEPLAIGRRTVDEELRGFVDSSRMRRDHRDDRSRQSGVIPVILVDQRGPSFEATRRREWIIDKDNITSTRKGVGSHCRFPSRGHPNPHERPPGPSAGTHPGYRSRRIAPHALVDFGPHNDVDRVCLWVGELDRLFASLLDRLSDLGRYRGRWSHLSRRHEKVAVVTLDPII